MMTDAQLKARDAKRDIGAELLESVRQMKAGQTGRSTRFEPLPDGSVRRTITGPDIAAILAVSVAIPMTGNLIFALMVDRVRSVLSSPAALRRLNLTAGVLLIAVGGAIALM